MAGRIPNTLHAYTYFYAAAARRPVIPACQAIPICSMYAPPAPIICRSKLVVRRAELLPPPPMTKKPAQ
ncbi:hypothetical protein U9M48_008094 [Paspalum notatum var. saurae]|uniref:Uncharacterized protein n=1 Tax=Paspalum notatum var. saurae TaxID=547442 RepID=A0AAQ3SNE0_PASNO